MRNKLSLFVADWKLIRDEREVQAYYSLGTTILFAGLCHFLLIPYFLYVRVWVFAIYNSVSTLLVGPIFQLCRKGQLELSSILIAAEVVLYTFMCTVMFGWGTSCQWYILACIIPHFLYVDSRPRVKALISIMGVVGLFGSFFLSVFFGYPIYFPLENNWSFRFVNLVILVVAVYLELRMNDLVSAQSHAHYETFIKSLEQDAMIDPLTKLWNRRYAEMHFRLIDADSPPLCVAIVDIDHFKEINDTHGHAAGDDVLRAISGILKNSFRAGDVAMRWGGEEFVIVLKEITPRNSFLALENLRKKVESETFLSDGVSIHATVTIGFSCFIPGKSTRFEDILEESDRCLYHGKRNGRNQVVQSELPGGFGGIS